MIEPQMPQIQKAQSNESFSVDLQFEQVNPKIIESQQIHQSLDQNLYQQQNPAAIVVNPNIFQSQQNQFYQANPNIYQSQQNYVKQTNPNVFQSLQNHKPQDQNIQQQQNPIDIVLNSQSQQERTQFMNLQNLSVQEVGFSFMDYNAVTFVRANKGNIFCPNYEVNLYEASKYLFKYKQPNKEELLLTGSNDEQWDIELSQLKSKKKLKAKYERYFRFCGSCIEIPKKFIITNELDQVIGENVAELPIREATYNCCLQLLCFCCFAVEKFKSGIDSIDYRYPKGWWIRDSLSSQPYWIGKRKETLWKIIKKAVIRLITKAIKKAIKILVKDQCGQIPGCGYIFDCGLDCQCDTPDICGKKLFSCFDFNLHYLDFQQYAMNLLLKLSEHAAHQIIIKIEEVPILEIDQKTQRGAIQFHNESFCWRGREWVTLKFPSQANNYQRNLLVSFVMEEMIQNRTKLLMNPNITVTRRALALNKEEDEQNGLTDEYGNKLDVES